MVDLRNENELAALIKMLEDGEERWQDKSIKFLLWAAHRMVVEAEGIEPLDDTTTHDVLAQFPNDYHKLDDELIREARDLADKGVSYAELARVMESKPNGPESISRETIRRYVREVGE